MKISLRNKVMDAVAGRVMDLLLGTDAAGESMEPDERLSRLFDGAQEAVIDAIQRHQNKVFSELALAKRSIADDVALMLRNEKTQQAFKQKTAESDAYAHQSEVAILKNNVDTARAKAAAAEKRAAELRKETVQAEQDKGGMLKLLQGTAVRIGVIRSEFLVSDPYSMNNTTDLQHKLARDPEALAKAIDQRLVELLKREEHWLINTPDEQESVSPNPGALSF